MSQLLISAIVSLCLNSKNKIECVNYFGNCVADYKKEDIAFKQCKVKWEKYSEKI